MKKQNKDDTWKTIKIILLILIVFVAGFIGVMFSITIHDNETNKVNNIDIIEKVKLNRLGVPDNQIENFPKPFGEQFKKQFED